MISSLVAPRALLRCCRSQLQPVAAHTRSLSTRRQGAAPWSGSSAPLRPPTVLTQRKGQSEIRRMLHATRIRAQDIKKEAEKKLNEVKDAAVESAAAKVQGAVTEKGKETTKAPIDAVKPKVSLSEDIWTLPNVLTMARLASTPYLGYLIINDQMKAACALLFIAGSSDALDGWIARRRGSFTVFGSIADPAADKALMTTMVVALGWRGLLPLPLAALIIGRDVLLVISAFFVRYRSLPAPKTIKRYFDPSLPSAQVKPTQISKINTLLQLILVGGATILPVLPAGFQSAVATPWMLYMGLVAVTTVWSGFGYLGGGGATRLGQKAAEKTKEVLKKKDPPAL